MKPELSLLVWATLLTLVQAVVAVQGAMMQVGLPMLAGNREGMPEIRGWGGRAARAHRNMLENLVLFAALVLAAMAAGKTNDMTLLGAHLFFCAPRCGPCRPSGWSSSSCSSCRRPVGRPVS